jgi:hypothetical protein
VEGFTRYELRKRAEALNIEVRYGQFKTYIEKGLLPDPEVDPWTEEEIVPRFLRIHELEPRARSLDQRVVILYLERYPVPSDKLRDGMIGMLPTIGKPVRTMARVATAGRWFNATYSRGSLLGTGEALPPDWMPPKPLEWAAVLRFADLDVFAHRLDFARYYASLLANLGKGTPHALEDLEPEKKLVLLMIEYFAAWRWYQEQGQARMKQAATEEHDA